MMCLVPSLAQLTVSGRDGLRLVWWPSLAHASFLPQIPWALTSSLYLILPCRANPRSVPNHERELNVLDLLAMTHMAACKFIEDAEDSASSVHPRFQGKLFTRAELHFIVHSNQSSALRRTRADMCLLLRA